VSRVTLRESESVNSSADPEQRFDLALRHALKVVGHLDLTGEEPKALGRGRGIERRHLDQRFPCFGNHERLAPGSAINQPRELRFRFVDIDL
jgi:hypothetical protein